MTINVNVVRRFAYGTRTDMLKQEPVAVSSFFRLAPRTPLNPPMAASATVCASVLQVKLAAIQIRQVEIVATPASQPVKATVIPPAIRIHQVDMAPRHIGMPRALHIRKEAVSRSLETRTAREASRRRPHVYQSSLRDHRTPEVACV